MELPHDTLARMKMLASLNGPSDSEDASAGSTAGVLDEAVADSKSDLSE